MYPQWVQPDSSWVRVANPAYPGFRGYYNCYAPFDHAHRVSVSAGVISVMAMSADEVTLAQAPYAG